MLVLQQVSFSYKRHKALITDANITIPRGYLSALVGRNGAGKTTLLKLLYGALSPQKGKLLCDGEEITKGNMSDYHNRCAFVTAENWAVMDRSTNWHLDYFDELYSDFDKNMAEEILDKFHFPMEDADRSVDHLSTGQKMQVQIAIALAKNPDYIIMDEPLANIDPIVKVDMLDLIQNAVERGCGVILSTHLMEEVEHLTDQVLVMEDGKIIGESIEEDEVDTFDNGDDNKVDSQEKKVLREQTDDCIRVYRLMQRESRRNVRYNVAVGMALVILAVQWFVGIGPVFTAAELFLMAAMVYEYCVKYTQLRVKGIAGMDNLSLAEWLRFHKYPAPEYSRYLLKKFLPVWIIYGLVLVINAVPKFAVVRILYILLWAVIPPVVMQLMKVCMQWKKTSENSTGKEITIMLLRGIYHILFLIIEGTVAFLSAFGAMLLLEDFIQPRGWSESIPTSMTNSFVLMLIVCSLIFLTFLLAMSNKDEFFDIMGMIRIPGIVKLRWILGVLTIVTLAANIYICSIDYTIYGGERFVVSDWGRVSEYTIDDIAQCHMYYGFEEFHLDVTFTDGREVKLLGNGAYVNNDLWTETYDNDYSYALELSEELLARGVIPVLDDEDEIRAMVQDFDASIIRDFEKLADLL